jgi:hypothetical protein
MTVEDDRDNSPLEEQIFGVILLVPLFTVFFDNSLCGDYCIPCGIVFQSGDQPSLRGEPDWLSNLSIRSSDIRILNLSCIQPLPCILIFWAFSHSVIP